jgi:acetylornithine deacetylase/succinyl-diaminopimelate desuccinylase-like protein
MLEAEPRRSNYVVRVAGDGSSPEALLLHGHLDVVPAEPEGWRHHPFSGHFDDGCLWGRGAVDMKGMIAMTLAVVRRLARIGKRPRRELVLAFFADE